MDRTEGMRAHSSRRIVRQLTDLPRQIQQISQVTKSNRRNHVDMVHIAGRKKHLRHGDFGTIELCNDSARKLVADFL